MNKYPDTFVNTFINNLSKNNEIMNVIENNFPLDILWDYFNDYAEKYGFLMEDFNDAKLDEGELLERFKEEFVKYIKEKIEEV